MNAVRNYNRRDDVSAGHITGLLKAWGGRQGSARATHAAGLCPATCAGPPLHASERADLTLQSTALVHEVYLRLTKAHDVNWNDRAHFFALSAQIMRRILVDAARARTASKRAAARRGRDPRRRTIRTGFRPPSPTLTCMLCALDDALDSRRSVIRRRVKVIELRFFAGLSVEETAGMLQVSSQTVMRDWRLAKVWLARELGADGCR